MPINIIDNFKVNISKPIDTRLVVADLVARNAISFLYDGLKVFQQDDRRTYTWNSGSSNWSFDNDNLGDGYIPKFSPIGFTNSVIFATASNISVNTYIPNTSLSTKEVFQLNNPVPFGSEPLTFHFSSEAIIGYNWYFDTNLFTEAQFDGTKGSSAIRFNDNGVILFSPNSPGPTSVIGGPSMMRLNPASGVEVDFPIILNGSNIYAPSTSVLSFVNTNEVFRLAGDTLRLADGTSANPILSFSSSTGTGIYSPTLNSLGISVNGWSAAFMSQTDVSLAVSGATGLSLTSANTILSFGGDGVLLTSANSVLSFGGNTVSISSDRVAFDITGSVPFYQSLFSDKVLVMANDILANVHQQGTNGIGDSGNYPYFPDGAGGGIGPWNFPSIASGLFTLVTVADTTNVTGAAPSGYTTWMRVGNVVSVSGQVAFNVSVANTGSSFTLTLPIKSYFGTNNYWQLNGTGKILNTAAGLNVGGGDVACIQASIVGDRAQFNFRPTSTGAKTMMYHYQYVVATYINSPAPPGPPPSP